MPAPWISAPMRLSMSARSVISGSRAAFSMTVSPLASTAAVRRFSVAPTLGNSSTTRAPGQPVGARLDEAVHDVELDAHRLQPAEVHVELAAADVVTAGHRHTRLAAARQQRTEHVDRRAHARHELVRRLGVQRRRRVDLQLGGAASTRRRAPIARSTSIITSRSATGSTLRSVVTPGASNAAAICLVPAFLVAPETRTVPCSGPPARTTKESLIALAHSAKLSGSSSSTSGAATRHTGMGVTMPGIWRSPSGDDGERVAEGLHDLVVGEDLAGRGGVAEPGREVDRHADEVVALEHDHACPRRCRSAAGGRCWRSPSAR